MTRISLTAEALADLEPGPNVPDKHPLTVAAGDLRDLVAAARRESRLQAEIERHIGHYIGDDFPRDHEHLRAALAGQEADGE